MLCRASTMGRKRSEQGQTDGLGCALVGRQWTGIAFDPAHRWRNDEFGYVHEKMWMFMDVMHSGSADECRSLEKDLIQSVRRLPGCYNTRPGGEGVRSATPGTCYCYAVYAPAGSGVGVHAAWRHRVEGRRGGTSRARSHW